MIELADSEPTAYGLIGRYGGECLETRIGDVSTMDFTGGDSSPIIPELEDGGIVGGDGGLGTGGGVALAPAVPINKVRKLENQ